MARAIVSISHVFFGEGARSSQVSTPYLGLAHPEVVEGLDHRLEDVIIGYNGADLDALGDIVSERAAEVAHEVDVHARELVANGCDALSDNLGARDERPLDLLAE